MSPGTPQGRLDPGDRGPRNPDHHRAILALSTAFWDAFLRAVLDTADRWQHK